MSVTRRVACLFVGALALFSAADVQGDTRIALTSVVNPGQGSVWTVYQIGVYEITNEQYCEFLNAVARDDVHELYHPMMADNAVGGIVRMGSPGSYTYAPKPNYAIKPVFFVRWNNAARFINWLENGRPSGAQGPQTTEDGVYTMQADEAGSYFSDLRRNPDARWFLPTLAEWKKAAYWDPNKSDGAGWWKYATRTNTLPMPSPATPVGALTRRGANVVNFQALANWNGSIHGNVTTIGSGTTSAYGTYDQNGNVYEWTETRVCAPADICGKQRAGGAYFSSDQNLLHYSTQGADYPDRYPGKDGADGQDFAMSGIRVAARCTADIDRDGRVGQDDFANYLALFTADNEEADLNGDGVVDFVDLLRFVSAYDAGC